MARRSIHTSLWGQSFWHALHFAAAGYPAEPPEAEQAAFFAFFSSLQLVLPCANCREHYQLYWAAHQADCKAALAAGRDAVKQWVLQLHNTVNQRLGEGREQWTLQQVSDVYEAEPEQEPEPAAAAELQAELSLMKANRVIPAPIPQQPRRRQLVAPRPPPRTVAQAANPAGRTKKKDCKNCGRRA